MIPQKIDIFWENIDHPSQVSKSQALQFGLHHQEQRQVAGGVDVAGYFYGMLEDKWNEDIVLPGVSSQQTEMDIYIKCGGMVREQNQDPKQRVYSRTREDRARF